MKNFILIKDSKPIKKFFVKSEDLKLIIGNYEFDYIVEGDFYIKDSKTVGIIHFGVEFILKNNIFSDSQMECLILNRELVGRPYKKELIEGKQNL